MSLTAISTDHSVGRRETNSRIIKRTITLYGHKTGVSLEDQFWDGLRAIATSKVLTVPELVEELDHHRKSNNLSSAIRLFVLEYYQNRRVQSADHK